MSKVAKRIGIVAPGSRIEPSMAEQVKEIASSSFPSGEVSLSFHPQCFLKSGHFAGTDLERQKAFVEFANDPNLDAIWFARGGYGACRLLEGLLPQLNDQARRKTYLGYSDAGSILAALYGANIGAQVHGPMVSDLLRENGRVALERSLRYLVDGLSDGLELQVIPHGKYAAFNITILSQLLGTPYQPDLSDHVLMLEEVSEHLYRIDRHMFHLTSNPEIRKIAGLRLGRCQDILPNDPAFERSEEEIVQHWCSVSGIPYLGRADIGHDADNKIIPFGHFEGFAVA